MQDSMFREFGTMLGRAIIGLSVASHGAQKQFGWFGGPGHEKAAGFMKSLGWSDGDSFATLASSTEMAGGVLTALGLGGPIGPGMIVAAMTTAAVSVHFKNGWYADKNGVELPVIYIASAIGIATAGFGDLSIDRAAGLADLEDERVMAAALIGAGLFASVALLLRGKPAEA